MKYFNTKQEYETYVLGGLKSGDACYVAEDNSVHFRTNNVDGTSQTYNVNGGSSAAVLIDGEFNENGVYEPEDADGYAKVTINVPQKTLINETITENGIYEPENADGYSSVAVAVQPNLTTETITENGTYTPTEFDGYSSVTVNVPTGGDDNLIKDMIDGDLTSLVIPDGITKIRDYAFYNFTTLQSVTIPDSVTIMGQNSFYGCSNLTDVTIGNGVTSIGTSAFNTCTGLTNVTIGNSVTSIGMFAFQKCENLTEITIPNSVTSIGDFAFQKCTGLITVIVESTTPPNLSGSVFNVNAEGRKIYVPDESVDTYKAASNWSTYADDILPMSELS